jgi:hypothetical protein
LGLVIVITALLAAGAGFALARAPLWNSADHSAEVKGPDEQKPAIDAFVKSYFESWSARDMKRYGEHFHPSAVIWMINYNKPAMVPLAPFLRGQEQAHASSKKQMREYPLETDYVVRNELASVWVYWELDGDDGLSRGYDFFTLARLDGRWRIVSLVFNSETKP